MTSEAPRAFNRGIYHNPESVFYGTDDGNQDGSFSEFADLRAHHAGVEPWRHDDIHMISVVGGLYGLNLIPLWRPKRLTIFDINPVAVSYFRLIHRVWISSRDVAHFLDRLTRADYPAETDDERFVQENITMKQRGCLDRSRGSTKRPYEQSWQFAFEHFELTKQILRDVPLEIRTEPMESESFGAMIRAQSNLWIYGSNIAEFHYFDLTIDDPRNTVAVQIIFPGNLEILDLAGYAGKPVKLRWQIPLVAEVAS